MREVAELLREFSTFDEASLRVALPTLIADFVELSGFTARALPRFLHDDDVPVDLGVRPSDLRYDVRTASLLHPEVDLRPFAESF